MKVVFSLIWLVSEKFEPGDNWVHKCLGVADWFRISQFIRSVKYSLTLTKKEKSDQKF